MNEKYLNLEGRFLSLQSNMSELSERILPGLDDSTKHRMSTVLEFALINLAHDMSTKTRKNVKVLRIFNTSDPAARPISVGTIRRSFTEVTIPTSFAVYQQSCRNSYSILSTKVGHKPSYSPSYPESLDSFESTCMYSISFRSAYGLFKSLHIESNAA